MRTGLTNIFKYNYFAVTTKPAHPKPLPKVYFDIKIENEKSRRIVFELFENVVPKTTENFRRLALGDVKNTSGKSLSYKSSLIHKIIPGLLIQGGDVTTNNGTGGESIYGKTFADESFAVSHDKEGILSMVNNGPNTNSSQFFITLSAAKWLDGKNVAFGEVIFGLDVLNALERLGSTSGKVAKKVVIESAGVIDSKDHKYDRPHHHDVLHGH